MLATDRTGGNKFFTYSTRRLLSLSIKTQPPPRATSLRAQHTLDWQEGTRSGNLRRRRGDFIIIVILIVCLHTSAVSPFVSC